MERVLGVGGYFMRAAESGGLVLGIRDCLGLDADENGAWRPEAGVTVFATFESETEYFGSRAQQDDAQLPCPGPGCDARAIARQGSGRDRGASGHGGCRSVRLGDDPEGNRVELWQPS